MMDYWHLVLAVTAMSGFVLALKKSNDSRNMYFRCCNILGELLELKNENMKLRDRLAEIDDNWRGRA